VRLSEKAVARERCHALLRRAELMRKRYALFVMRICAGAPGAILTLLMPMLRHAPLQKEGSRWWRRRAWKH